MHRTSLLALLALLAASCGSAANRPEILATYPAQGQVLSNVVYQVRVTYDEPVTTVNDASVAMYTGGTQIPVDWYTDPADPNSLIFQPKPGNRFLPGDCVFTLGAGFEANAGEQYRLENFTLRFTHGVDRSLFLAVPAPAEVVQVDVSDLSEGPHTACPAGRTPLSLASSAIGTDERIWVQFPDGGGDGKALAWFRPGDAAMTEVSLSHEAGGDLVADLPTLALGGDGRTLYGAWRDTALGRIRLCAVDVTTATEAWTLVLSPAASAATRPLGLVPNFDTYGVDVSVVTDADDLLCRVDTLAMTEVDLGPEPGVDGLPIPGGAGPVGGYSNLRVMAPLGRTTADLTIVDPDVPEFTDSPSAIVGAPEVLFVTLDGRWVFEGLTGYAGEESIAVRFQDDLVNADPRAVTADAGPGTPAATRVNAIANYPGVPRAFVLFDNSVISEIVLQDEFWVQVDQDPATDGVQGVDVSAFAPGATGMTYLAPSLAP